MKIRKLLSIFLLTVAFGTSHAEEQNGLSNKIEKVDFATLSGGRVAVKIRTAQPRRH
jgi:hypothetical protein